MPFRRSAFFMPVFSYWNWKCALLSATVRSLVYVIAMTHTGSSGRMGVVLCEVAYVTLTAGIYAGLQQRALRLPSRALGNLLVLCVPALAQLLDWTAHLITRTPVTARGNLAVCIFSLISALFHLHVMRNGAFLTGHGRGLADDFRAIPKLIAGFVCRPFVLLAPWIGRPTAAFESDAAH